MNYQRLARSDLYDYAELKFACETLPGRIADEKAKRGLIQSSLAGIGDVKSRDYSRCEDKLISSIARITTMEKTLEATKKMCSEIENALSYLTEEERATLEERYMYGNPDWVETLGARFFLGKTAVYNKSNNALKRFVAAYYGTDDLRYLTKVMSGEFDADDEDIA